MTMMASNEKAAGVGAPTASDDGGRTIAPRPSYVTFGEAAQRLEDQGFEPLPIVPGEKRPPFDEWQIGRPVAELLPRYASYGIGLLTRHTPALDIDVLRPEVVDGFYRAALAELGDGPCRIGRAPKRLLMFRTAEPFAKVSTAAFLLPGDPIGDPGFKGHRVEILADGQQFVAFGIHPDTHRPYAWLDDSPLNLERHDLPEITAEQAAGFIEECGRIFIRLGGTVIERERRKTSLVRRPGPPPRPVRDMHEAKLVIQALRRYPNRDLGYYSWLDVGYALKAALGDAGWPLFRDWSATSEKNDAEATERAWRYMRPERAGWRFLIRLAEGDAHARR